LTDRLVTPARAETLPPGGVDALLKERLRGLLLEARERTLRLVEPVSEADMNRVHDPLMSPLVWDLGHIAAYEDLWVGQRLGALPPLRDDLAEVYDAAETPRAVRGGAPYLRLDEAHDFMEAVRERTLDVLESCEQSLGSGAPARDGFVWELVLQHEHQHDETMLQTLALAPPGAYSPRRRMATAPGPASPAAETVRVPAGTFPLGAGDSGFAYDNERPRHEVSVAAFEIDRVPVTNGAYREFVDAGGYQRRELWSPAGWDWRSAIGAERPLYWAADGRERSFDRIEPLDEALPVMHVSWYEADAYARWRGKRLPTEAEWEKAASWDAETGDKRRYPWGDDRPSRAYANLDQMAFGPAPAGAHPEGGAPCGALGMVGDAWEWTSGDFGPYPGFRAFPYREYSEVFFGGGYKVLRGGSWATRPHAIRNTFRNWDLPQRRQIHAGFRCAVDA
jgi:gamma-glutamyl hercynylcysteine S-oxide synthase